MDKSVLIFILFALAFAAAVVGGVLFLTARRLPAQIRTSRLSNAARVIEGRISADGSFRGEYKGKQVHLGLSADQPLPHLHIYLQPVSGTSGWQLSTETDTGLTLKADREGYGDALIAAGLEQQLGPLREQPDLNITFQPDTLHCAYQLNDPYAVPAPEAFTAQLDALLAVAALSD